MSLTSNVPKSDLVAFPPLPLATGDQWMDEAGNMHPVDAVRVQIAAVNGQTFEVPLVWAYGGWWVRLP